jgi:hypothetical protein
MTSFYTKMRRLEWMTSQSFHNKLKHMYTSKALSHEIKPHEGVNPPPPIGGFTRARG